MQTGWNPGCYVMHCGCSSHSPLVTASMLLFCTASISWHQMLASTLTKTWQFPHVHLYCDGVNTIGLKSVKFCKYMLSFLPENINIHILQKYMRLRFWKEYNVKLTIGKYYTNIKCFGPNRMKFVLFLNGKTSQRATKTGLAARFILQTWVLLFLLDIHIIVFSRRASNASSFIHRCGSNRYGCIPYLPAVFSSKSLEAEQESGDWEDIMCCWLQLF